MKLAYRRKLKISILKRYFEKHGGMANSDGWDVVVNYVERVIMVGDGEDG